ncbi:MAG TPA: Spy/CpxP family protein refolding chaperone [Steroidobacteraceae bacterium]|nr:Spy/CpxP family protein refolding chaperone [Steroidobacteraceae bacterium]
MNRNHPLPLAILAAAALACGAGGIALAQSSVASSSSSTTTSAPAGHRHWRGARHSMLVGTLLRAARQLNLTDAQKSDIKSLLTQARSSQSSTQGRRPDITVLGNPGDSGFAGAIATIKSEQEARLDRESALATSIYQVLTPEQQKALPGVLAQMQSKFQARRAAWEQRHASSSSGS